MELAKYKDFYLAHLDEALEAVLKMRVDFSSEDFDSFCLEEFRKQKECKFLVEFRSDNYLTLKSIYAGRARELELERFRKTFTPAKKETRFELAALLYASILYDGSPLTVFDWLKSLLENALITDEFYGRASKIKNEKRLLAVIESQLEATDYLYGYEREEYLESKWNDWKGGLQKQH